MSRSGALLSTAFPCCLLRVTQQDRVTSAGPCHFSRTVSLPRHGSSLFMFPRVTVSMDAKHRAGAGCVVPLRSSRGTAQGTPRFLLELLNLNTPWVTPYVLALCRSVLRNVIPPGLERKVSETRDQFLWNWRYEIKFHHNHKYFFVD